MLKFYYKLLQRFQNNKAKIIEIIGMATLAIKLRYDKPSLISTYSSENPTQYFEQINNYIEDDLQLVNTSGKVNFNKTDCETEIEVKRSVTPSKALEYILEIRSGNIQGVDALGINPSISRPSSSKCFTSQTSTTTSLNNNSPDFSDSSDSDYDTFSYPDKNLDQVISETLDDVSSSSFSSSNDDLISEVPESFLDYEVSDSEEIYDEEYNTLNNKQIYSNGILPGYKSAIDDSYTDSVYQYKYSTFSSRFDRFLRREIYANKKEHELFNKDRTQEDLIRASKINIPNRQLKNKLWRHPDFFGLTKPNSQSKTPKEDFFRQHGEDVKRQLRNHLLSPYTRSFKNGLYREHNESYDYYYNNQTGKLLLIRNNAETGEQEIFSFWNISKMQRLELLNHNHVHKNWKLVEALQKKAVEETALVEAQNAQKHQENRLNEIVSPVEAARRASDYIKKNSKTNNDT